MASAKHGIYETETMTLVYGFTWWKMGDVLDDILPNHMDVRRPPNSLSFTLPIRIAEYCNIIDQRVNPNID